MDKEAADGQTLGYIADMTSISVLGSVSSRSPPFSASLEYSLKMGATGRRLPFGQC